MSARGKKGSKRGKAAEQKEAPAEEVWLSNCCYGVFMVAITLCHAPVDRLSMSFIPCLALNEGTYFFGLTFPWFKYI